MFVLIPVLGPVWAGVGAILGITVILKGHIVIPGPPPTLYLRWISLYPLGALIFALSF